MIAPVAARSVLLSHPHAAVVANEAAAALAARGLLSLYATGFAWPEDGRGTAPEWVLARWPALRNRMVPGLRRTQLRSLPLLELGARALARASIGRIRPYDALFWAHDRAVASLPWPAGVDVAYAYEDAALATFERARKRGIPRIWDLPAPHYRTRERVWREEPGRWPGAAREGASLEPEWKLKRKDGELALATGVIVASSYTMSSLREAGYGARAAIIPYGFPLRQFPPKDRARDQPFTVLAVGSLSLAKGTPYLLEAWRRADVQGRLRLVGPLRLARTFMDRYAGRFEHVPHVPRALLGSEYRQADLLVFPTLGDGFGLVMQEAMCSGTPVLATPCSGAPECITTGNEGWIVPERSVDALTERIREAALDRDRLDAMGRAARSRAEHWTWAHAGAALADAVEQLCTC